MHPDHVGHQVGRQDRLIRVAFLLHDDLQQHLAGDVFAGLGVFDADASALADHLRDLGQPHIAGGGLVVELAAGIAA